MDEMKSWILRPLESTDYLDLSPEFYQYHDKGCELAESCLNCPFPGCIYDKKHDKTKLVKQERAREMARFYTEKESSIKDLATMFGVSSRTMYRDLKHIRDVRFASARRRKLKRFVSSMKNGTSKGGKKK
jgi:hypothetical protein